MKYKKTKCLCGINYIKIEYIYIIFIIIKFIMSRNNIIAVAKQINSKFNNKYNKYYYYVIPNLNTETQFTKEYILQYIFNNNSKYTTNRGKALCIAHDIQKKIDTEYGVNEIDIY